MDISATPPQRIPDLLRFLRQMGYAAEEVDSGLLEVEDGMREEAITLSQRLLIWSQVNKGDAQIIGDDEAAEVGAPDMRANVTRTVLPLPTRAPRASRTVDGSSRSSVSG